ncbi:hypothetical protein BGX24_008730 [Mortierella sp. AD032]|nr:hypothetical protein BGX24_008730 [Mortierella sp. AD032]
MQLSKSIFIALTAAIASTIAAPTPVSTPEAATNAILPPGGRLSKFIITDETNDADASSKIIVVPGDGTTTTQPPYPGYPSYPTGGGTPTVIIIAPLGSTGGVGDVGGGLALARRPLQKRAENVEEVNDASKIIIYPGGGRPRPPFYPGGDPTIIIIKPFGPYGSLLSRGGAGRRQKRSSAEEKEVVYAEFDEASKLLVIPGSAPFPGSGPFRGSDPFHGSGPFRGNPIYHRGTPYRPFPKRFLNSSSDVEVDAESSNEYAEAGVEVDEGGVDVEARSKSSSSTLIYPPTRPNWPGHFQIM